jgi:hypothetical protein
MRNPRDRIFSLISLCPRGGSLIVVDYNVSLSRLAYAVLTSQNNRSCLCTAAIVTRTLPTPLCTSDGPWVELKIIADGDDRTKSQYVAQRTWWIVASQLDISDWSPAEKQIHNVSKLKAGDNVTARVPLCKVTAMVSGPIVLCDPGEFETRRRLHVEWE